MGTRRLTLLLALLLAVGLIPAAGAADSTEMPLEASDNLEHITNIEPERPVGGSARATDSDFYTWEVPEDYELPESLELPEAVVPEPGTTRHLNLMGTYLDGLQIIDTTVQDQPVITSVYDCRVSQADVFVFSPTESDRTYVAYTLDAVGANQPGGSTCHEEALAAGFPRARQTRGTFIIDVTDPYRVETVSFLEMRDGSHQTTVHPSGDYVYNSAAVLGRTATGLIEVYDVRDPGAPEKVAELELTTGLDSHDMTFAKDGDLLVSAALTHSLVIDTSDPADPQILGRVLDPAVNIHHDAHVVTVESPIGERDFLLVGDELAGAAASGYCPGGGIHVYDITDELVNLPVKVGAYFIPDTRIAGAGIADSGSSLTCTAHVMQPIPGTTLISMAWYNAGARVLDYSGLATLGLQGPGVGLANIDANPVGIQQVAYSRFDNSNLWSAKVDTDRIAEDGSFYIYGGDTARGIDVWHFSGGDDPEAERGSWLDVQAALQRGVVDQALLPAGYKPFCLLPTDA